MSEELLPYLQAHASAVKLTEECQRLLPHLPIELFTALAAVGNALQYKIDQIQHEAVNADIIAARMAEG